jgi:hypothetical protein
MGSSQATPASFARYLFTGWTAADERRWRRQRPEETNVRRSGVVVIALIVAGAGILMGREANRPRPQVDSLVVVTGVPVAAAADTSRPSVAATVVTQWQFLDQLDPQVAEWNTKVRRFAAAEIPGDRETRARVTAAWDKVMWNWGRLHAAGRDGWEACRPPYDVAWDEFIQIWKEANNS